MRIEDGKGNNGEAAVSKDQRLEVNSKTGTRISYASKDRGDAYIVYGKRNFAAANTDEGVLYFKYTGNRRCVIDHIVFSSNSSKAKAEVFLDPTSVSAGTSITPVQLNRTKSNVSDSTALHGGTTAITFTPNDALEIADIRMNISSVIWDVKGALVLGKNNSILIVGEVATIGDRVRAEIYYYEEDVE